MVREGYIEGIRFHNPDNGYTVLDVDTTDGNEFFVGNMVSPAVGTYIIAEGEYYDHPQYSIQFKFTSCEIKMPDDVQGIQRYLGSGIVKGIGEVLAKRIVQHFKMDTIRIIEEEPERLAEIKGISPNKARDIAVSYSENRDVQQVLMFLTGYGITINLAMKIYKEYGNNVYSIIRDNPYKIAEDIVGVGFKTADEIAARSGISENSQYRIRAAIMYTLSQSMSMGHVFLPETELSLLVNSLLGVSGEAERVHSELVELSMEGKVVVRNIETTDLPGYKKAKHSYGGYYEDMPDFEQGFDLDEWDAAEESMITAVYPASNYYMEQKSARMLVDLKLRYETPEKEVRDAIKAIEKSNRITLDDVQAEAVYQAISSGVAVITGGPGTGKTTIIQVMIEYFGNRGMTALLAAPTGRAAKRITESTGYKAQTIHRLLEFSGVPGEDDKTRLSFGRNEENPLECDAVIIDEASMVDSYLFYALLQAIEYGTRLILVGDTDQLPSVGAGNVLHDIIHSDVFPVTKLQKIFRQGEESAIITNAHKIKEGEHLEISNKNKDFFFIPKRGQGDIMQELYSLLTTRLPKYLKVAPEDIQVLTPMRKYELGVENLNRNLQRVMNPPVDGRRQKEKNDVIFREGDKVMQIKNNYKQEWKIYKPKTNYVLEEGIGVFNGDMGIVTRVNDFDEEITVLFDDGREVLYTYSSLDELEHAFAVTIHKSQGSEYPAVIIPLYSGPRKLLNRNLLYTAVTRAKYMVVLVGNLDMIDQMIDNVDEQLRYTTFSLRLREIDEQD